jgi:hypothetical protein
VRNIHCHYQPKASLHFNLQIFDKPDARMPTLASHASHLVDAIRLEQRPRAP